ncbi:diacylglycerol kinase family protein [Actinoplanes sp. Pm04-4]|uniref:Diacylglycerol kinase family protein n=1 Tax=Paractinoplanes pyxinae TaxID=2997416 RepID=A0ABT4BG63_9ACTN|nr:diacylglycerol kinase family protein [Actinoplanes pyxinae]MCY1145518.1 diacylglycerol kinase family protein [Actinoplanes pyxinae]
MTPGGGRRTAAVIALVAPLLAVAATLETTVRHFGTFLSFVFAVVVVTAATWYAVTRRGVLRWAAVLVAVLGALMMVTLGLSLFLTQAAMLVVFALAGRYALGPHSAAMITGGHPAQPVPAARHGVLLINPRSGDGAAARAGLADAAAARGIKVVTLGPGDDLAALAEEAVEQGADVLGMAGGDGSQALIAATAVRHGIAYVCVPAGTRNHFALDLGLDRTDVAGALDAFTDGVERRVDLGTVNGRIFVNNASLGVYAEVVRSKGYRKAKIRAWGRLLPDLLGPTATPSNLEFDSPEGPPISAVTLVLVSNNPYDLSRVGRAGGRPRLDTGRLGIVAARGARPVGEFVAKKFEVRSTAEVPAGLDGEALLLTPPLVFRSLPGALRVRVPRTSGPGRRPVALTRRDLNALIRVASGVPAV